jgi:hypothetical protein
MPQTLSVSWFLLVHMITGTSAKRGSRVMAGELEAVLARHHHVHQDQVGLVLGQARIASSPFSAVRTVIAALAQQSDRWCSSVLESSTTRIFWMGIGSSGLGVGAGLAAVSLRRARRKVRTARSSCSLVKGLVR